MSIPDYKMNSINPENISDIDPKTISFLTLIDGTILMVEQTAPINKRKKFQKLKNIIEKVDNFFLQNNKNKNSCVSTIERICLNNKYSEPENSKNNIIINNTKNKNNYLSNNCNDKKVNDINNEKDLSLNGSYNTIIQLNDFNESNKSLYNLFFCFSNDNQIKRKNVIQINKNNNIKTMMNLPLNLKEKIINKDKDDDNYICTKAFSDEERIKNYFNYDKKSRSPPLQEYINRQTMPKNKRHFRQLIDNRNSYRSVIKHKNIYSNKQVNLFNLQFCYNPKDNDVSIKFNKLVNKLKMNRVNEKSYNNKYNNINNSKNDFFNIYKYFDHKNKNNNNLYSLNAKSSTYYQTAKKNFLN